MAMEQDQYQIEQLNIYSFWKDKQKYKDVFKIKNKVMAEVDIFMPTIMYTFDVEILKQEKLLNIFEETILKLAEIEIIDKSKIHEAILLEQDLIKFIQGKLIQKKLLNNDNQISNNGISYLIQNDLSKKIYDELKSTGAEIQIKSKNNQYKKNYVSEKGRAFMGINQKISPIMEFRNIQSMYITGNYQQVSEKEKENLLNFHMKIGSAGNSKDINGILNRYAHDYLFDKSNVTQLDIKENFEKFFSKFRDLDHEINNSDFFKSYVGEKNQEVSGYIVDNIDKIKIISKEKSYIHYKVIILDGDAENIVVSDGFSMYDIELAKYIKANYRSITNYLNKLATKSKSVSKKKVKNLNNNINDKYPKIKENLKSIVSNNQANINAPDKKNKLQSQNEKIVADYYKVIGWVFYYYIKNTNFDYNNSKILNDFISLSSEHEKIKKLEVLLNNININTQNYNKRRHHILFELDSQKILNYKDILNGESLDESNIKIKIKVLLLLAVVEANQKKENSEFYFFINNNDENKSEIFLNRVFQILKIRNAVSHGESNNKNGNDYREGVLKKYYDYICELANYLLDDIYIDNSNNNSLDNSIDNSIDASQDIINANSYLSKIFAILSHSEVFEKNKKYFILLASVKINYLDGDDINISDIIKSMANLFEGIFRLYIKNLLKSSKKEKIEVSKEQVLQTLTEFYIQIPSDLNCIREVYFENACFCRNASLGAYLLLFINEALNYKN